MASNFLHAIARYWNCLVGDLSPSVIYFLNRACLPTSTCPADWPPDWLAAWLTDCRTHSPLCTSFTPIRAFAYVLHTYVATYNASSIQNAEFSNDSPTIAMSNVSSASSLPKVIPTGPRSSNTGSTVSDVRLLPGERARPIFTRFLPAIN